MLNSSENIEKTSACEVPPPPPPAGDNAQKPIPNRKRVHPTPAKKAPIDRGVVRPFLELRRKGTLDYLEDKWRIHGNVFRAKMGPITAVVIAHPDAFERVLASNLGNYVKGSVYNGARAVLGQGVLTSVGQEWRKKRTLMQPRFHRAALAGLVDSMSERSTAFFDKLTPGTCDAHHAMIDITLDIVVSSLFGTPDAVDIDYQVLGETLESVSERSNSFQLPLSIPTPKNIRFKRVMRSLDEMVDDVVTAAEKKPNPSTLLHMLMTSVDSDTQKPLSRSVIRDEIVTLFVAGHETTALTMTWMFLLLEHKSALVEEMIEEVDRVLSGRAPTLDDLPQLELLQRVTEETLRLRSPVTMIARNVVADDNLLGCEVKRGDIVLPFFHALHRHPDFWPDAEKFDPDRFLPEQKRKRDIWSYLPFSGGQRVCLGNHFAIFEAQIILATMLQRFRFEVVKGQSIRPEFQGTIRPSSPVRVTFSRR